MKILIVHKLPPFNRGGAEQVIWQTAKEFATQGHDITFFSPDAGKDRPQPEIDGIEFEWVPTSDDEFRSQFEFFLRGPIQYPRVYNKISPDIVYDNICPFPFHLAHIYGNSKVISKVHAVYRWDAIACKRHWATKVGTIMGEETYRIFSNELFITNSDSTSQRLEPLVSRRNKIRTNPLGINLDRFDFTPNPNSNVVLSLSKLTPRKNIGTLLHAWQFVESEYPSAELVVAGSGPMESQLHDLKDKLQLNNVVFRGYVSEEEKKRLLRDCFAYVLPTIYEGFGLSNLEAMASGLVTISTDTWGVKDYLIDGENGIVVKPNDPKELSHGILRCLKNRSLATRLMQEGRTTAEKYTLEAYLQREVDLLNRYAGPCLDG